MIKTYVMSDIHGCFDEFLAMLKQINFSVEDQLILAGDFVDRGNKSYEMLRWIENAPENVLFIKGNHEAEFAQCIELILLSLVKTDLSESKLSVAELYNVYIKVKEKVGELFDYYGTIGQLIQNNKVSLGDLLTWKKIIDDMPYFFKLKVCGEKYIIVHAGFMSRADFKLGKSSFEDIESFYMYAREEAVLLHKMENVNIIFGHTPTISKGFFYKNGHIWKGEDKENNVTFYNIDCGIAYRASGKEEAKLACMCLENKEIFYV